MNVVMETPSTRTTIPIAEVHLAEEAIDAAVGVLRSGQIRQGQQCSRFEEQFAKAVGARHAITTSSGTAALHLAWLALIAPGDEVLVPSFTFIATASAVVLAGGTPVFCDVNLATAMIDVEDARRRITNKTRAICPVHLFGNVADVAAIQRLAEEYNLKVIWDAAQAHGSTTNGRDVGGLDDIVCYSFYPTKNMTTAEGGMITTNDGALAERLRLLRSHGQSGKYYHTIIGLNYRMTDVQAAIGLVELARLNGYLVQRRRNAATLDCFLSGLPGITVPCVAPGVEHSYHQYTIQVAEAAGRSRDQLQQELSAYGIETAVHYPRPLHQQPVFAELVGEQRLPISELLAATVLSLPVHPALESADLARIGSAMRELVGGGS